LVGGLVVLERVLELLLPRRVPGERETGGDAAARVELQELVGHVAHRLLDRGLAPGPSRSSQSVESRLDPLDARVLLDEVEALDRQVEGLFLRVTDLHELALLPLDGNALQSLELADPIVAVHDRVAELQVAQVREEGFRRAAAGDGGPFLLAEDLAL